MSYTIITIIICIVFSAYFSATETAFSSLNKTRLKTIVEKGDKKARLAYKLSENYDKLISTILIGNNVVNIAASSLTTALFIKCMGEQTGPTVATLVITVAVLIFGEISPKSIAKDCPERFSMFSAPFMRVLIFIFTPLNYIFTLWKKLIKIVFKVEENPKMSQEELILMVEEVQQEGSIDDDEGDIIINAIEFTDRKAEDILTHRVDIEAVPVDATKDEIADAFEKTKFSRLLVYDETIDNIVGVIHLKDFYSGGSAIKGDIKTIITKPVFIQKSDKISDILKILQASKSHMAVVIDEYGGTLGIVSMEDILEELVGEIWDEHDEVVEDIKQITDDTFIVDGSVNFDDFCDLFKYKADEEIDSVSVGGWVMEMVGKIPDVGDEFSSANLSVVVTEIDSHRVTQIKVTVTPADDENDDEDEE